MLRLAVLALAFLAWAGVAFAAEPTFPVLAGRIVDEAQLLDAPTRSAVEEKLADLERTTGRQLVVVTLNSLQGYEIEDYGYRLGRAWGIGEKGKDNGALLVVAPNQKRVRIEVGYGLEGGLTDAVSRLIIENAILPRFRANDYAGGIVRGVDDIIQVLSGEAEDFKRRAAEQEARSRDQGPGMEDLIWIAVILGLWLFMAMRSRRQGARRNVPWIIPIPMGSPRYGGRGGFSGRGGSFGGGGASGRW